MPDEDAEEADMIPLQTDAPVEPSDQMDEEESKMDDNQKLDIKQATYQIEAFEINHHREEVGCIHEIFTPKNFKRQGSLAPSFSVVNR